jgi:hypothetical protein
MIFSTLRYTIPIDGLQSISWDLQDNDMAAMHVGGKHAPNTIAV